ncbi:hypothetical protein HZH66_013008 [Vespula vulgaris]|uniref:Uncharacterized protein n=1 Tax=Vespula vulgaris TaxID=7454 RepID=A0A834MUP4_VESVU|nr:hypothetical protein HZH66_013008 [Vespula vulgaris]
MITVRAMITVLENNTKEPPKTTPSPEIIVAPTRRCPPGEQHDSLASQPASSWCPHVYQRATAEFRGSFGSLSSAGCLDAERGVMPVTRVPTVFHPDGGGCDVNDEINHSKLSSDQCYQSELNCDTITTTTVTTTIATTVKSNIATSAAAVAAATTTTTTTTACSRAIGAQSRKRNHYAFVTFLRINMTAVIIGIIGVFVVQFAGTLGISNKDCHSIVMYRAYIY